MYVHVHERDQNAPATHKDGNVVKALRKQHPEVPVILGIAYAGNRGAFDDAVQVCRVLDVTNEEC